MKRVRRYIKWMKLVRLQMESLRNAPEMEVW